MKVEQKSYLQCFFGDSFNGWGWVGTKGMYQVMCSLDKKIYLYNQLQINYLHNKV